MTEPTGPTMGDVARAVREGIAHMREQLAAAGIKPPTLSPGEQEIVDRHRQPPPSPINDPEGYGQWDAERIDHALLAGERAMAAAILGELRVEAEALLDGTDEGDSARHVVIAALKVLARVQEIVVRELGHDWRGKVRPFGALARRQGAKVGAAWVGDTAGGVEPITLADAVELLAVDRAQFRREVDESRTRAGEAVAQGRAALQRSGSAERQVREARRYLEAILRPNARAPMWCEACDDAHAEHGGRCEDHPPELDEPELPKDLVDAIRPLAVRLSDAEARAERALHDRVSVYVGGQLVHGVSVENTAPEAERRRVDTVEWRLVRPDPVGDVVVARIITPEYGTPYGWTTTHDQFFLLGDGLDRVPPPWRYEARTLGWEGDSSPWRVLAAAKAEEVTGRA